MCSWLLPIILDTYYIEACQHQRFVRQFLEVYKKACFGSHPSGGSTLWNWVIMWQRVRTLNSSTLDHADFTYSTTHSRMDVRNHRSRSDRSWGDNTKIINSETSPLKFCDHRWLENVAMAELALEMWKKLKEYALIWLMQFRKCKSANHRRSHTP